MSDVDDRDSAVRAAMTLDDRLDDIKRVQIWARLADQLAEPDRPRATGWLVGIAGLAAAAALGIVVVRRGPDAGPGVLTAPAGGVLSTPLGPYTRAELVGATRVEVVGTPGDATAIRLVRGTLLADFAGGAGRSLRIDAAGATIDIVGTLFAVDVAGDRACVSVAHGKVRVTTERGDVAVTGGQTACSDDLLVHPIAPSVRDALRRHDAVIAALDAPTPTRDETPAAPPSIPILAPPPPPPPAPPPAPPPPPSAAPAMIAPPHPHPARAPRVAVAPEAPAAPPAPLVVTPPEVPPAPEPPPAPPPAPPAPPPAPAAPPPAPTAPPPTADALYEQAEAALGRRDLAAADRALARLIADFPAAPVVDQAFYERARIAYQRHAWAEARRELDRLAALDHSPLAEPGAYLACRIAFETHDDTARGCLVAYRAAYPRSPHDLDVLGLLAELGYRDRGCAGADPLVDELAQRHPKTSLARAWRARCPERR